MIAEVKNYHYGVPKYAGLTMSKADFLQWESDDNYVYEFNDGVLESTSKNITICTAADVLSAAPALPEFHMTVEELFRR